MPEALREPLVTPRHVERRVGERGTREDVGAAAWQRSGGPKVAYVMSRFPKLTETFVLHEILEMQELGCHVLVCPLLRHRSPVRHPEADALAARARFKPFLSASVIVANWRELRRDPRRYVRVLLEVLLGTSGSANFLVGALGIFPKCVALARELSAEGVEHVHAHFANHPALAALIVHRFTGIPYSFTAHGSDLHKDRTMLCSKLDSAAFAVAISEYNREVMVDECGAAARDRIHVIHCGVDPDVFVAAEPRTAQEGAPLRMVCVASFEPVKGHRYLLRACALLRERGVAFRCDLVGDGPLRRTVARWVRRSRLDGHVRLLGPRSRPEVTRFLRSADVAVLASRPTGGKREGIPVALMEAMACGLPVVATEVSGIPELVLSGRTGLLVPPGDPAAMAAALERLHLSPALRAEMGAAGRNRILEHFHVTREARRLLDLIAGATGREPEACEVGTAGPEGA